MIVKLQKWGNSQGIRISKAILKHLQISVGDSVSISAKKGQITIKPLSLKKEKNNLKDLVNRLPKGYNPFEIDWGHPVGKEEW